MAVLLAVAVSAGQWDKDTALLQEHADQITDYLAEQESEALNWVKTNRAALESATAGQSTQQWINAIENQALKDYTVLIVRGDSVLAWSNNKILPTASQLKETGNGARSLLQLPAGYFAVHRETAGRETLLSLFPIRYHTVATGAEQQPFPAGNNIPGTIQISETRTDYLVQAGGKDLCWLDAAGPVHSNLLQWVKLVFYALFFVVLFGLFNQGAVWLSDKYSPPVGGALLLAVAGGVYWLNGQFDFTGSQFGDLPLFAQKFESPSLIGKSLGDWLVNISLLVWLMVFFHRRIRAASLGNIPLPVRIALSVVFYLSTMMCILVGVEVLRRLVFHSGIGFDFENVLNSDQFSLLAVGGIILLMVGLFLFSHRMMLTLRRVKLSRVQRAAALAAAAILMGVICFANDSSLQINPLYILGLAVLYAVIFDVFVHWVEGGFGWIVIWLLMFSLFGSVLLYRYNDLKDREIRLDYAKALAQERDLEAVESLLPELLATFRRDSQRLNVLLKPWPFKPEVEDLSGYFNSLIFKDNYLFQHYRLNVFAFDRGGESVLLEQSQDYNYVVTQNWSQGQPLPTNPGIRFHTDADGKFRYMMALQANRMNDAAQPVNVFCFFDHEYPAPSRVYAQLFYNTPYKNLKRLSRYDFAVLKNGKLVVEQGQGNIMALDTGLENGEAREIETEQPNRLDAVYKSKDGQTIAVVGRPKGGSIKQLYLFSMLFTLASLFLFALALANSWLHFLPEKYQFRVTVRGSLAKRIQYWMATLIGLAFFVVGLLTYHHFTTASRDAERASLDYRAEAMLTNLKTQLLGSSLSADSLSRSLPKSLSNISGSLSMDANLYSLSGNLEFSTQDDLKQLGILPGKMNPLALATLKNSKLPELVEAEKIAGFDYYTKYLPLRTGQNQLLGFLGVPYQLSDRKIGAEVSDFIGMLASLYVFLLFIAFVVTILLARSITRPLTLISEKIKVLKLEDKNQPLQYQGDAQDELSELIGAYNRMVEKLENSKVQLVRLEREGAWREMARQVAHDIKNPLTTMKLSMQQLERVSGNPEQAAAYLRKAITRLIEQIDSLAQIASEFSMFANLDIRQKSDMVVNEVVESVYDLFSEQKNVALDLQIPSERYHILGDKNHLIRVFNNLVINAIQAIPSDRDGQIRVSLNRDGNYAIIKISDNGGGIPPEIRERVFEPNFTTKTSGSGLGLAICKKIIEAHDGTIRFETRENEGTDFFVEMPITAVG
ncbi:MAG: HAMP domain-containing histidine kinase [Lewinellaceae bacterium]|nr:HAMP domain-containing histidine kinase [Lewinellaceae bacterium]